MAFLRVTIFSLLKQTKKPFEILVIENSDNQYAEKLINNLMSEFSVKADAIIEGVAEAILNSTAPVRVVDDAGQTVGSITAAKIVHVLFGSHATTPSETAS